MPALLTVDERERRFIQYVLTLHKGQIGELRLRRMGEISNFRKALRELIDQIIEKRAEDLAAGMLLQYAPPRPEMKPRKSPALDRKRVMPRWIKEESKILSVIGGGR